MALGTLGVNGSQDLGDQRPGPNVTLPGRTNPTPGQLRCPRGNRCPRASCSHRTSPGPHLPRSQARKIRALVLEFPWQRTTASHVQLVKQSQQPFVRSGARPVPTRPSSCTVCLPQVGKGKILEPGHVTLNKSLNPSVPQFLHPDNGNIRMYLRVLSGGLNESYTFRAQKNLSSARAP